MSRVICVLALVCVSASAQLPKPGGGGSGGGGGGGGGAVDSVFGRVGTVSATSGDYAIDQITNGASIATQNAFAAGATQTFVADGTNSGVQIQCTPLPSTPVAGSIVCDSADGNTLKFWTGTNYIRAGTFGVQDEGVALPSVSTINFTGAGIACTSDPGNNRSNCAVSGSGGGTGLNSLTATQPLISGGTLTDPTLGFGYAFVSTINTPTYTIQASDVGHIKRVSSANRVDITINLMTYPFTFYIFNDNVGPVVITASAGDINGDATLTLLNQEGAFFSLNQTAAFWRGINTSGRVQSGASVPSAARCDEVSEAGQIFVRNAAAATNASLYVCANTAASTYAWEGPFNVTGGGGGGASSFSQLSDFKAVETSATTLTITPGLLATGNFAHPATIGGAVTFSGSTSGIAHIFLDDTGQLITEATTGIGMADTGQMTHRSATTPVIPETAVPLCSVTVASGGVYTVTNCTQGTRLRNASVRASTGLLKSVTNGINTLSVDPATVCLTSGNCGTGSGAVTRSIWWSSCGNNNGGTAQSNGIAMGGAATTGPTLGAIGTDPWKVCTADFKDAEVNTMIFAWLIPSNWDAGTISLKAPWRSSSGAAGTGVFTAATACVDFDTTIIPVTGPTLNAKQNFSGVTVTTAERLMSATLTGLTTTGCAAGEMMFLEIQRNGSSGSDTMDADQIRMFGVEMTYGTN